ncbi:MAG: dTDP-4-dehydrorhamnose reductase [Balneolaceae bacterium]
MNMLVTGAGGQLAREWNLYLNSQDRDFVSYRSSDLDIGDPQAVTDVLDMEEPAVIINCAAYTDVDGAEDDRETAMKVNRDGVKYLAAWCREHRAVLVHYSTDYVFPGERADLVTYPKGYPEEAETRPVNVYGESKLAGEKELLNSGADYLLVRISWLCGQYGSNFVKTMLRLGRERSRIDVVKDQLGSPTYTGSVTKLTGQLLNRGERGIFHITSAGMLSWYDLAEEIFRYSDMKVKLEGVTSGDYKSKAPRPFFSKLDTSGICRTLGTEMIPWQKGLHRLIDQLK